MHELKIKQINTEEKEDLTDFINQLYGDSKRIVESCLCMPIHCIITIIYSVGNKGYNVLEVKLTP